MPTPEQFLQMDLFTGELVDTRTAVQKRKDRVQQLPHQLEMFSAAETFQHVNPHPQMALPDHLRAWKLTWTDTRTPDEIERHRRREEEKRTYPLATDPVVSFLPIAVMYNPDLVGIFSVLSASSH